MQVIQTSAPRMLALGRMPAYHAANQKEGSAVADQMTDNLGPQPEIVLVRPQMGENIGAAARAMLNFGLERMRIIAPRDGWPNPSAVAMASGAGRVLDAAGVYDTLADGIGDCDYVYATTARTRDLAKPILSPERAMAEARAMRAAGKKVAILFGPERTGLENDEVARANATISVPVNPEFASLNLAQCVLLTAYEWRRQTTEVQHEVSRVRARAGDRGRKTGRALRGAAGRGWVLLPADQSPRDENCAAQYVEPHADDTRGCADFPRYFAPASARQTGLINPFEWLPQPR